MGCSPRGLVTFISETFGGAASDRQILEKSNDLLKKENFKKGDMVLADRGMMCQDLFSSFDVKLTTPHVLKGASQLPREHGVADRRVANKRVHVERVIGYAKRYSILTKRCNFFMLPHFDRIIFNCFMLRNFKKCIMNKHS